MNGTAERVRVIVRKEFTQLFRDPRMKGWLGVGLTAYGLLGLAAATLVVVAALAVGPEVESALARVDQQRDTLVATLESSASALERTAAMSEVTPAFSKRGE